MSLVYKGAAVLTEGGQNRDSLRWVLVLDAYQRDNLLALINWTGCPGSVKDLAPIGEFGLANTGDWVHEIAGMLADPNTGTTDAEADGGYPNVSRLLMRKRVAGYSPFPASSLPRWR